MLKFRTYLYSSKGEFLKLSQLSKARWFRVRNNTFDIEHEDAFPPKLKVSEKLEYLEYIKKELNSRYFQTQEEENSLFLLKNCWTYITFDNNGNELFKEVNKKSKYFSIFRDDEIKISDKFPPRMTNKEKLNYLNDLSEDLEIEEKETKRMESEVFSAKYKYFSNILGKNATSNNLTITFPNVPVWVLHKKELREIILKHASNTKKILSEYKKSKNFRWQLLATLSPVIENGEMILDHEQVISTPQLSNFNKIFDNMILKIDQMEHIFRENYEIDFDEADIGFKEFTLCLIQ